MLKNKSHSFNDHIADFFRRWWWVMAFIIVCTMIYEQGLKNHDLLYRQLTEQQLNLQQEKQKILIHQKKLQLQVSSQQDAAWIELVLMQELGVVPSGQQKIYFYPDQP
jgi:cell division protein FtsL